MNNILNGNRVAGISINGDTPAGGGTIVNSPIVRVFNNTFYGVRNGDAGLRITNGVSPIAENNIFANLATGVSVDAASTPTSVVQFSVFQNNINDGWSVITR